MFTKILLVATFIFLAWSFYELTKKNQYIESQISQLISLQEAIVEQQKADTKRSENQEARQEAHHAVLTSIGEKTKIIETSLRGLKNTNKVAKAKPTSNPKSQSIKKQKGVSKKVDKNKDNKALLSRQLGYINELYKKRALEEASAQLLKFKEAVWKNRKDKRVSKKAILALISSIDITIKRWNNNETTFDLSKVNDKFTVLFSATEETSK